MASLIVFVKALSGLANARAHFAAAAAQEEIVRASSEAQDELAQHPSRRSEHAYPSEAELRQAAYDQTMEELHLDPNAMPEHYSTVEENALRDASMNGRGEIEPDSLYERVPEA